MSNSDQNNQVYRQGHSFTTGINQIFDYYDNKIRALEQQIEVLQKNKLQKHETETVPNNPVKKAK